MGIVEMLCKDLETKEISLKDFNCDMYSAVKYAETHNLDVLRVHISYKKSKITILELQYFCDYLLPIIGKDLLKKFVKFAYEIGTISYCQRGLVFDYINMMEG